MIHKRSQVPLYSSESKVLILSEVVQHHISMLTVSKPFNKEKNGNLIFSNKKTNSAYVSSAKKDFIVSVLISLELKRHQLHRKTRLKKDHFGKTLNIHRSFPPCDVYLNEQQYIKFELLE